jgi:hypothetical protein
VRARQGLSWPGIAAIANHDGKRLDDLIERGRNALFSLDDSVIKIYMQPKLQLLRALTILSQGPSLKIRTRQFCNFF